MIEEALEREVEEESGLKITKRVIFVGSHSFFKQSGERVLGLTFLVDFQRGEVKINNEFSEFAWVGKEDLNKYQLIDDVREEVMKVLSCTHPVPMQHRDTPPLEGTL